MTSDDTMVLCEGLTISVNRNDWSTPKSVSHIEQISQIRNEINSLASSYKNFSGSKDMIISLDELSISTHAKVQDMFDSNEIVSNLMPLVDNPEALSRAV
ncbi:MAG: hypothetical protein QF493_11170, partial [Rhodospirillales bacterium]|nr:hypothetical protein [Rhodospirillales bacterium]